mmetsp:Transcript_115468/g.172526  ORF Transcript_115468/g.172526 Transcript_115468/m.172526 type:complete len:884 (-) Transcript_115468:134-2785(-)
MAAKQGLSAQISQASEDAKRAVLQRTSLTNSLWFSNLNTTCTIKSAPPRTPEVLNMLASKCGWLLKRNEQHVWQARYCCVVPHTFLYYFDQNPTNPTQAPSLTPKQQEFLNKAVRQGYGKRGALKQQQPRSSLYHVLGTGTSNPTPAVVDDQAETSSSHPSTVQPAGIIDLECYSTVHRNSQNQLLLELAGDESVNPDLRSFYFCANSEDEGEEWTQAFLGQRHSSLVDEKEAYRQVCDGFAQQLQMLHSDLENTQHLADSQQDELYRVRSQMEDTRRSCLRLVQDTLERSEATVPAKKAYRTDLETIQAQDLGILAAVQLLCDYTRVLEETCGDSSSQIKTLEEKLEQKQEGNSTKVTQLEEEMEQIKKEMNQQQAAWQAQLETLQQKYLQSQKECQDVQKDLASQRMEMTMYQSSTRTKISELHSHKKILKKEVIDLRKKVEEANSHLDVLKHKESSVKLEAEQERQKAKLLERYVEKMESQVKVQQNMMEMMSATGSHYGGASQYGGGGSQFVGDEYQFEMPHSPAVRSVTKPYESPSRQDFGNVIVNTPSSVQPDDDEDDDVHAMPSSSRRGGRGRGLDDDAKSHMSELTEDRTQKQFDAAFLYQSSTMRQMGVSPRSVQLQPSAERPPSIIGVAEDGAEQGGNSTPKLDTIMSVQSSTRGQIRIASLPRNEIPRYDNKQNRSGGDGASISSSKSKMSVAQRARMEADAHSTPVRVRLNNSTPLRGNSSASARKEPQMRLTPPASSNNSSSGTFFSNLGRRIEDALDSSVLGVGTGDESESSYSQDDDENNPSEESHQEEKKSSETMSEASAGTSNVSLTLSLAERQALQRAQQLKFLKEQGLINAAPPSATRASPGTPTGSEAGSSSIVSNPFSRRDP